MPNQTTLRFNEETHRYRLDGKSIRGVTGLIGDGTPSKALIRWAGNTVADWVVDNLERFDFMREHLTSDTLRKELRGLPESLRDKAAVRGNEIHRWAHPYVHREELEIPERIMPWIDAYAEFLEQWKIEPILTEVHVGNRHWWYAGTPDLICTVGALDPSETWCIDLKTGKYAMGNTCLQTAAYSRAEFYVNELGQEVKMPEVHRHGLAHITTDGVDFYDLGSVSVAFQEFVSVQNTAKSEQRRKKLTETPLDLPGELKVM